MSTTTVNLGMNASADVGDLKVTFAGSAPVHFGGGMPAEGSVLLDVAAGGESERLTLVGEGDFEAAHDAPGGYKVRVSSPYSNKRLAKITLEVTAP